MIACVNPSPEQGSETVNTLRYASRAKRIEVCPEVNLDPQEKLLRSLKREVASLRQENGSLREQLRTSAAQSEAGGATAVDRSGGRGDTGRLVRSREASLGGSDDQRSNPAAAGAAAARPVSKGSYQSLYEMLQEYMQENETLRSENLDLAKHQTDYRREQNQLSEENRRLASQLSRMRRQFEQQQQQQQQQQRQTPVYVVSNPETPTRLPLIEARREAEPMATRNSARLPPRSPRWSLPPTDNRESQRQQQQQPVATFAPTPPLSMPIPDVDRQPRPIPMPPPPPPLLPASQQYPQQYPQQSTSRLMYPEAPVYVPQPGERTYRERFEAAAGRNKLRGDGGAAQVDGANNRTVQSLARLNASLRGELRQLDGAIQQHQRVNALQSDIRRNEGRKVLSI
ncbi:hypothetical protein BOX15_Mlig018367g1 [Macrostomum lignano]|uniref:Kinesin motor domain-containing protein n=1 Tax=Macrostomum lignano TaxID=282301 RepID=A0A267H959_9PLAT|nr:hypothetical protein BOX15_Mlig018367g1 [Macrostomum lignano]